MLCGCVLHGKYCEICYTTCCNNSNAVMFAYKRNFEVWFLSLGKAKKEHLLYLEYAIRDFGLNKTIFSVICFSDRKLHMTFLVLNILPSR